MKTDNNFKIGDVVICIKTDNTNSQLITLNQKYTVLDVLKDNSSILIVSDVLLKLYIDISFFTTKKILRKNKLNKLKEIVNEK